MPFALMTFAASGVIIRWGQRNFTDTKDAHPPLPAGSWILESLREGDGQRLPLPLQPC